MTFPLICFAIVSITLPLPSLIRWISMCPRLYSELVHVAIHIANSEPFIKNYGSLTTPFSRVLVLYNTRKDCPIYEMQLCSHSISHLKALMLHRRLHCNMFPFLSMMNWLYKIFFVTCTYISKPTFSHNLMQRSTLVVTMCIIYIYIYIYIMDCVCQRNHKECSTRTCADDCYNCWKKSKLKSYVGPWFHG